MHREIPMGIVNVDPIGYSRCMDNDTALLALTALAHPTRLATFRLLVRHEPAGMATGQLAATIGLTQSTFSTHLAVLAKAGLVKPEKQGRSQIQHAEIGALSALMIFLAKDCCQGHVELCEPLVAELTCC